VTCVERRFLGTGRARLRAGRARDEHNRIFERFLSIAKNTRAQTCAGSGYRPVSGQAHRGGHGGRVVVTSPVESGGKAPRGSLFEYSCPRRVAAPAPSPALRRQKAAI